METSVKLLIFGTLLISKPNNRVEIINDIKNKNNKPLFLTKKKYMRKI